MKNVINLKVYIVVNSCVCVSRITISLSRAVQRNRNEFRLSRTIYMQPWTGHRCWSSDFIILFSNAKQTTWCMGAEAT